MSSVISAKEKIEGTASSKQSLTGKAGASSGAKNYADLEGKPSINGVEVSGDKTAADYGVKPNDIIVNISGDKETGYTSDKTFAEIKELLDSGHTVKVKAPNKAILSDIYLNASYLIMWQRYEGLNYLNVNITRNDVVSFSQNVTKASDIQFGGVMADAKTDDDTIPARIGEDGKLYVAAYSAGSSSTPRQELTSSDIDVTLSPNILYVFPEMPSLAVSLETPKDTNIMNEYRFFFTSGATPTDLKLPTNVVTHGSSVEANKKYEVSILEGIALIQGVPINNES